ncbi:MAG: hypothetical protein QOF89_2666 [Acidobacteriota bacterium]|jgi:predicted dithiol-disulfide oxidoreductase (DUF899 family)|nr:hypothetical protein [Acidobacteriota bacterium]
MSTTTMNLPQIVSPTEWQAAHEELLAKEPVAIWIIESKLGQAVK